MYASAPRAAPIRCTGLSLQAQLIVMTSVFYLVKKSRTYIHLLALEAVKAYSIFGVENTNPMVLEGWKTAYRFFFSNLIKL